MEFNVGIYLFDEIEVLDFAGPFEVFSTAARVKSKMDATAPKLFEVFTLAESMRTILTRGKLQVVPDYSINEHPNIDILIIPGGVVQAELDKPAVIDWIKRISGFSTLTASVCTGAFLLARAGLLHNQMATTHWEDIEKLRSMFPDIHIQSQVRWVDNGKVITSAGISAGIDMSLYLVERLVDKDLATATARKMDYDWKSV
jgi:transcriptional regulator GlxA family with amidase domain